MSANAGKPINFEKHAEYPLLLIFFRMLEKLQKQMVKKRLAEIEEKLESDDRRVDRPKGPGRIRNI